MPRQPPREGGVRVDANGGTIGDMGFSLASSAFTLTNVTLSQFKNPIEIPRPNRAGPRRITITRNRFDAPAVRWFA